MRECLNECGVCARELVVFMFYPVLCVVCVCVCLCVEVELNHTKPDRLPGKSSSKVCTPLPSFRVPGVIETLTQIHVGTLSTLLDISISI